MVGSGPADLGSNPGETILLETILVGLSLWITKNVEIRDFFY